MKHTSARVLQHSHRASCVVRATQSIVRVGDSVIQGAGKSSGQINSLFLLSGEEGANELKRVEKMRGTNGSHRGVFGRHQIMASCVWESQQFLFRNAEKFQEIVQKW